MKTAVKTAAVVLALLGATAPMAFARGPALDPGCAFIISLNEYTCPGCGC